MATAPRNVNALDDVDGPEDLDNFVKELMDNMVRNNLTSFFDLVEHYSCSNITLAPLQHLGFNIPANSIQPFER